MLTKLDYLSYICEHEDELTEFFTQEDISFDELNNIQFLYQITTEFTIYAHIQLNSFEEYKRFPYLIRKGDIFKSVIINDITNEKSFKNLIKTDNNFLIKFTSYSLQSIKEFVSTIKKISKKLKKSEYSFSYRKVIDETEFYCWKQCNKNNTLITICLRKDAPIKLIDKSEINTKFYTKSQLTDYKNSIENTFKNI